MKEEFIALQIKRIRRNINFLLASLIIFAIFVAFNIGVGLMLASIILFVFIMHPIKFVTRLKNIKIYSVNKAVSIYGGFYDVSQNINSEILSESSVKYENVIITDSWILKHNTFSLDVINIADIVWAYHNITSHKQGAIIPGAFIPPEEVGKTFAVIINSKNPIVPTIRINTTHMSNMDNSKEVALAGMKKQQRMRNILDELQQRNSYAIFGYSRELSKMWIEDKNRFIEQVNLGSVSQNLQ